MWPNAIASKSKRRKRKHKDNHICVPLSGKKNTADTIAEKWKKKKCVHRVMGKNVIEEPTNHHVRDCVCVQERGININLIWFIYYREEKKTNFRWNRRVYIAVALMSLRSHININTHRRPRRFHAHYHDSRTSKAFHLLCASFDSLNDIPCSRNILVYIIGIYERNVLLLYTKSQAKLEIWVKSCKT